MSLSRLFARRPGHPETAPLRSRLSNDSLCNGSKLRSCARKASGSAIFTGPYGSRLSYDWLCTVRLTAVVDLVVDECPSGGFGFFSCLFGFRTEGWVVYPRSPTLPRVQVEGRGGGCVSCDGGSELPEQPFHVPAEQ